METNTKNNGQVKGNQAVADKKGPQFVAGNPVNKESEKANSATAKAPADQSGFVNVNKLAENVAAPAESVVQANTTAKPALNLDETIKLLEALHVKKVQRDRLLFTINNLEGFTLDLEQEADETGGNYYQGCVLKIADDEKNEFTTKNPVIIQAVAEFVKTLCVGKLAEIEAGITIPA